MRRLALLLAFALPVHAEDTQQKERAEFIRSHYGKYEYAIPMRDGIKLFTTVYVPNGVQFDKKYPILMVRTPYSAGPYGLDRYKEALTASPAYEKSGYIFAFQDVRGRWMSEGEFVNMRPCTEGKGVDEATDTYDTIEWMTHHIAGNNGKVGMHGISYPGFYAAYGAIQSHPALKAVSPQAPIADWWRGDDMHRNGAFNLQMTFGFFANFAKPRPLPTEEPNRPFEYDTSDAYEYFLNLGPLKEAAKRFGFDNAIWNEITQHPNYDSYWQARNLLPHLKGITAATMLVAGWYDAEDLYGPLNMNQAIPRQNPGARVHLVVGPWSHGGWANSTGKSLGDADFGYATAATYAETEFAFFEHYLKGADDPHLARAWVYETGANRWRSFKNWPPAESRPQRLQLQPEGKISSRPAPASAPTEYLSDPRKPIPYTSSSLQMGYARSYMAEDQRYAARRPDVAVFQTPPLDQDFTLAGPIEADLYVSTSAQDADWIVKLVDVNPGKIANGPWDYHGGQQTLVRGEPIRGRFRNSWSQPEPFSSNQPTHVKFTLNDVCHTFARHHRLMVQIQSSWFPYLDINPQSWVANIFQATPDQFVPATHRIYHDPEHPSALVVHVLEN